MEQELIFMSSNDKKELEIVKKDNRLIEANYKLTINCQRLLLAVLGNIRADDEEFKLYKINIKEIAELHGLKTNKDLYDQIQQSARTLKNSEVEISIGKKKRFVNWLNYVEYEEGQGEVSICFNKQLKPYLLQLKANFTQYQLAAVINFKSAYSIRFYEFLKMRQNQGKGGQFFIRYTIFDLRDILGIATHEYPNTKNLRVRVIEPALKEIDTQSDLAIIDVQYIKQGRAINEIIIYAEPKKQRAIAIPKQAETVNEPVEQIHPVIEAMMSFGLSFELAKSFKIKHGVKKIERNIAYTLAKKQAGEVKNIPAYLSKAIEGDWGNAWENEHEKEREKIKKREQEEKQKQLEKEELSRQLEAKNNALLEDFYVLPPENREELIHNFLSWISNSSHRSIKPRFDELLNEFGESAIKTNRPLRSLFITFLKN